MNQERKIKDTHENEVEHALDTSRTLQSEVKGSHVGEAHLHVVGQVLHVLDKVLEVEHVCADCGQARME